MLIVIMAVVALIGAAVVWFSFSRAHRSLESNRKKSRVATHLASEAVKRQNKAEQEAKAAELLSASAVERQGVAEKLASVAEANKQRLTHDVQQAEHRLEEAKRRFEELESRTQATETRGLMAERRTAEAERHAEITQSKMNEVDRNLDTKQRELAVAEEELRKKKHEATEEIASWTRSQTERLQQHLSDQYQVELGLMKTELAEKLQAEFERIQQYFLEFAKSKSVLAGEDIQAFVNEKLSLIQKKVN